jgi:predicted DNA-binding ribbon-helix-helix protein
MKRHTVFLYGRSTSVSVEDAFWKALAEIATSRQQTMKELIKEIDQNRQFANLSSLIRLFVLEFYKEKVNRPTSEESTTAISAGRAIEGDY